MLTTKALDLAKINDIFKPNDEIDLQKKQELMKEMTVKARYSGLDTGGLKLKSCALTNRQNEVTITSFVFFSSHSIMNTMMT